MTAPFDYCPNCGGSLNADGWPIECGSCEKTHYANPAAVAVILQPVGAGLLTVRRDIDPGRGELALPGGFIDLGETWQAAAARELREETGLETRADEVEVFDVVSAPDGTLLVFALAPPVQDVAVEDFDGNFEVSELVVVERVRDLAFSLHTQMLERWLSS